MIRRPPRSTRVRSSAASDVYKRQRENFALMGESRGVSEGSETISSAQGGAPGGAASASQVYERKLGLARFSEEPIFLHRDEDGETVVQMAEKPPMPIRYLLDLDASKALK